MFPGSQVYPEGRIPPERGLGHKWHVWCATGALQVLHSDEIAQLQNANPEVVVIINFANGAAANIWSGHPLWEALKQFVTDGYTIEVFGLSLVSGKYEPWTGEDSSLGRFDSIKVTKS